MQGDEDGNAGDEIKNGTTIKLSRANKPFAGLVELQLVITTVICRVNYPYFSGKLLNDFRLFLLFLFLFGKVHLQIVS